MSELIYVLALLVLSCSAFSKESHRVVEIKNNQLVVDNVSQPQIFGAEVQYFRLRGGYGPNVPRAKVIELWNKALDRVVEAKMNAVSFYIPWDFHEYAEGKFDFTGTIDEDGDGNPDYPSRDVKTFLKLVEQHGIKKILVRPGPYINAEWGFLGFGAVPEWFHEKFPESHMLTPWGWRTKLFDYLNPDFLKYTQKWFEALYEQVLKNEIGFGKPVVFLQLDNETNYQWQSLYTQDYGPRAVARYRDFLKDTYINIGDLNSRYGSNFSDWAHIQPPTVPGKNYLEDQDWYRFNDQTMYQYIQTVRKFWEDLGVREPQVLFTLAESYNAAGSGILPHFKLRNAPQKTGLMTVNLYPKTFETPDKALLNFPFKADLDVKSAEGANANYYGSSQKWVMGPEIQGGWWKTIDISQKSRQQTYLTVLGHGMKSFFIYYFNEGQNWGVEWGEKRIRPLFEELKDQWHLTSTPASEYTNEFWGELQARSDRLILMGLDVRRLMQIDIKNDEALYFDSPLDGEANPRDHYSLLKFMGEKVISPYQDFLARAVELVDEVAIVKDSEGSLPSPNPQINSLWANSDWTGSLLGYLMNADINPTILHGDISPKEDFAKQNILFHVDSGVNAQRTKDLFKEAFNRGQSIVNFIGSDLSKSLGFHFKEVSKLSDPQAKLTFYRGTKPIEISSSGPVFTYDSEELKERNCEPILFYQNQIAGFRCRTTGGSFTQVGALLFTEYNSSQYSSFDNSLDKKAFINSLLAEGAIRPRLAVTDVEKTVAFGRVDPKKKLMWITAKTGSTKTQVGQLKVSEEALRLGFQTSRALRDSDIFKITDLFSGMSQLINCHQLIEKGFDLALESEGSTVFVVELLSSR